MAIRVLPIHVANKIAAGEVVERPASVLKELLENSIDAGATRIDVNIVDGGRKLVSVRDNGCGMTREDAVLSLERQATSKIRDVDDIERISTLGFRGEAIPSIAAVSRFTLQTRAVGTDVGTELQVNAGRLALVSDSGVPVGTTVEVRDLFINVPARRKFLRTTATEESHIKNIFTQHALAHPDIAFILTLNGSKLYSFLEGSTLSERIHEIFGSEFLDILQSVEYESGKIKVHGFIERPSLSHHLRHEQYFFVNARPAIAPEIRYALSEVLPVSRGEDRASTILFLELPPEDVDVNVHPTKREVRFRRSMDVRNAIMEAISGALSLPRPQPSNASTAPLSPVPSDPTPSHPETTPFAPETRSFIDSAVVPASRVDYNALNDEISPSRPIPKPEFTIEREIDFPELQSSAGPWRWFEVLSTTKSGFILLETDAGIVLVNPKAARERIAYEKAIDAQKTVSQPLLIPVNVHLTPSQSAIIRNYLDVLQSIGFEIGDFGNDMWKIDAVPQILSNSDLTDVLSTIATDLGEGGSQRGAARWREEMTAKAVAKAYASTPFSYTNELATMLVRDLASTRMPYINPRGKPTMIFRSTREIKNKFQM